MTSAATRLSRVIATSAGLAIALAAAAPAHAAGFLKLGDIKGESSDKGHGGQIEIESWSWGESRASGAASGDMRMKGSKVGENAPAAGGKANVQDVSISKTVDKSTPKLMEAKVLGSPAPRGSLTTLVPAGTCKLGARYPRAELDTGAMRFEMENVLISSCAAHSGGGSESRPMESLSLNYEKIVWK